VELEVPAGAPVPVFLELDGDWRAAIDAWRELDAPYEAALAALAGDERAAREAVATLRSDVDHVVDDLRQDAGETLPKAAAARVLGVSRGTLEKWIGRAMISTRTVDGLERVERAGLEEIAAEVAALRRLREDNPAVLAEALTRLADRDPEFAGMKTQIARSLTDIERGELVPLRIPESFGPGSRRSQS